MGLLGMFEGAANGLLGRPMFAAAPASAAPPAAPAGGPGLGDKLMNLIINGETFQQTRAEWQDRQLKQALMSQLGGLLGPGQPGNAGGGQMPPASPMPGAGPAPGVAPLPSIADPRLARAALLAPMVGMNINPMIDVLKANKPEYVNGVRVNPYDQNAPGFVPTLDKGQEPLYNSHGEIVGVRNMDGSIQAAADMTSATEGAKARAQAHYQLPQVNLPNGSTQQMPGDLAADVLSGGRAGSPTGLGRSQSPSEKVSAEGHAKTQVERDAAQPQQFSGLQDQARTTDLVINTIDKALSHINRLNTGPMAGTAAIPGTPARDLQAILDTIRSNVGFEQLAKMRAQSPTGGALGQVSEQENRLLQSVLGAMDQGQSPAQLRENLSQVSEQLKAIRGQRQQLYNQTYAKPTGPSMQGKGYRIISVE